MRTVTLEPVTVEQYARAFETERAHEYPMVDAFEARMGYAVDRDRLEAAAYVLACPLKANPPNWQHGRVLYAAARKRFAQGPPDAFTVLDIGTAKGFSALCLQWALNDHIVETDRIIVGSDAAQVFSVDVIDPEARVARKTVAEVDGLKTLAEILSPWPESQAIRFQHMAGIDWLCSGHENIEVAFVDGKHTGSAVYAEGRVLAARQERGDVAIFDDVHTDAVSEAVGYLGDAYDFEWLQVLPNRAYAIGVRR